MLSWLRDQKDCSLITIVFEYMVVSMLPLGHLSFKAVPQMASHIWRVCITIGTRFVKKTVSLGKERKKGKRKKKKVVGTRLGFILGWYILQSLDIPNSIC